VNQHSPNYPAHKNQPVRQQGIDFKARNDFLRFRPLLDDSNGIHHRLWTEILDDLQQCVHLPRVDSVKGHARLEQTIGFVGFTTEPQGNTDIVPLFEMPKELVA
jgi:hypothetical protein